MIQQVYYSDNTIKILISSNSNQEFHGFKVNIYSNDNQDTLLINSQLQHYSTISIIIKTNLIPSKLEIFPYYNNNHKLVFSSPITYTFNGNEQQIQEQQPSITTIEQEQPTIPQKLVNNPDYISYTSISKLDNEKNIIYFTKDHINSNRITTNNQGDIEYQANYQPYGSIYTQTGNEKYKFSGKELDSSNLYYFGARYYNSNIGRFTQVDPIYKPTESPYQYANNNPIKYVDPTGQQTSGCENGANCGLTSSGNVPLDAGTFTYPAYNGYTAGGTLNLGHLDNGFYEGAVRAAVEHGIDPYYFLAVSITEAGPVNTAGHEAKIAPR